MTYRNLEYQEAQLCRNWAQRWLKLHHTDTHARKCTHRMSWAPKEHNCHSSQRSAGLAQMSSCSKCSFKPLPWCASLQKYVYNKALCTISHWHASLIPLFIFAATCPEMDDIMPDGDAVSLSAGRTLFDPALWQLFAQGENNSLLRLQIQYVLNASLPKWLMTQCKRWKIPICSSMSKCGYAPPQNTHIYWLFLTFSFTTPLTSSSSVLLLINIECFLLNRTTFTVWRDRGTVAWEMRYNHLHSSLPHV